MASSILTYDPKSVTILIAGWQLVGLTSVSIEWKSRPFVIHKGIRGINTRVYNPDMGATMLLDVLPTSITNDVLSDIVRQDIATKSARIEITMKDTSGTTYFQSVNSFLSGYPNVTFNSDGIEVRRWELEISSFVEQVVGGNAGAGIDINDLLSGPLDSVTDFAGGIAKRASDAVGSIFN